MRDSEHADESTDEVEDIHGEDVALGKLQAYEGDGKDEGCQDQQPELRATGKNLLHLTHLPASNSWFRGFVF